jgi:predicted transcriptional regulator
MTITLHLSPEVQRKLEALATQNGQNINIIANTLFQEAVERLDRNGSEDAPVFPPNEKMLAILSKIEESHKDRPFSDGSETDWLLREARAGAMFGYDPTE